jgi:hypothetical protein
MQTPITPICHPGGEPEQEQQDEDNQPLNQANAFSLHVGWRLLSSANREMVLNGSTFGHRAYTSSEVYKQPEHQDQRNNQADEPGSFTSFHATQEPLEEAIHASINRRLGSLTQGLSGGSESLGVYPKPGEVVVPRDSRAWNRRRSAAVGSSGRRRGHAVPHAGLGILACHGQSPLTWQRGLLGFEFHFRPTSSALDNQGVGSLRERAQNATTWCEHLA